MPSSPKVKTTEWVSKAPKAKEPEKPKAAAKKVTAPKDADKPSATASAPATSTNGAVNPLARFMQLKPGQWKCPGCSVLNEATSAKCPCCETAKPGGAPAERLLLLRLRPPDQFLREDLALVPPPRMQRRMPRNLQPEQLPQEVLALAPRLRNRRRRVISQLEPFRPVALALVSRLLMRKGF